MKLEILSQEDALKYFPLARNYGIRIFSSKDYDSFNTRLINSENWIDIKNYIFDDKWPVDWKEFDWVDVQNNHLSGLCPQGWNNVDFLYNKKKENFIQKLENQGFSLNSEVYFDLDVAENILKDYDSVKFEVEKIMIHCYRGQNRSPAVGMALNDIYKWGIKDLDKKFPFYRRFVYDKMINAAKKMQIL